MDLSAARPRPLETIPAHLEIYLSHQDYSLYTPMDHAGWRFIMKVGQSFFARHAHAKYLDGLRETGISTERIPRIEEMDAKLRRFGWRAVPVIGFIPPAAFLEFQSHGLLPIACDMRKIENLNYTPAPDIVHEAAGHAPIVADPAYAAYLRGYGEVSRRAIFSSENMNVYYAVRRLSDTKERPDATPAEIGEAERNLEARLAEVTYDSEVDWVTRLGWWTTEYGLVGDLEHPKIYGAGLLSSIGESYHCLSSQVRKLPLTLDCIHQPFNITEPQPQLFVTPDFDHLSVVLEELASRLAFRMGGEAGLAVALRGRTVCTVELETGIQISGVLQDYGVHDESRQPAWLRFSGPVQLAYADTELPGHGAGRHPVGLATLLGGVRGLDGSGRDLGLAELSALGVRPGQTGRLEFESGFVLEGAFVDLEDRGGRILFLVFNLCRVARGDFVLHRPEQGPFILACGREVRSVFGGAADRYAYLVATEGAHYEPGQHKTNLTPRNRALNDLYARVRTIREEGSPAERLRDLQAVVEALDQHHPRDWLLRWELLELDRTHRLQAPWSESVRRRLEGLRTQSDAVAESVERGIQLLS